MLFITGGLGFIGMHATREFVLNGEKVAVSQHRTVRDKALLEEYFGGKVTVAPLDMTDGAGVLDTFSRLGVTSVVHLLAPPPGIWTPSEEYRANMIGLLNLLEAGEKLKLSRITLASSQAVYAGLPRGPFRESQRLRMQGSNPTEAFKKAEEVLAGHYADRAGMNVVLARLAGIYGPGYHSMVNLPSRICHAAVKGRAFSATGPDGSPTQYEADEQDLCYVKDAARGLRLLHSAPKLRHRVYNIGSGLPVRADAIVAATRKAVPGFDVKLAPGSRPGGRTNVYMDISRVRRDAGYEPQYDIDRGIGDYVSWLKNHPE